MLGHVSTAMQVWEAGRSGQHADPSCTYPCLRGKCCSNFMAQVRGRDPDQPEFLQAR